MKNKQLLLGFVAFVFANILAFFSGSVAFAAGYNSIEQKAYGYGVYNCYVSAQDSKHAPTLTSSIKMKDFAGYNSVIGNNMSNYDAALLVERGKERNVKVPCKSLIAYDSKGKGFDGLLYSSGGVSVPTTTAEKDRQAQKLGYIKGGEGGKCFTLKQTFTSIDPVNGPDNTPTNMIDSYRTVELCGPTSGLTKNNLSVLGDNNYAGPLTIEWVDGKHLYAHTMMLAYSESIEIDFSEVNSIDDLRTKVMRALYKTMIEIDKQTEQCDYSAVDGFATLACGGETVSFNMNTGMELVSYADYSFGDNHNTSRPNAAFRAIKYLLGADFKKKEDLKFNEIEKAKLYGDLLEFYGAQTFCPTDSEADKQASLNWEAQGLKKVPVADTSAGGSRDCFIIPTNEENRYKTVNGLNKDGYYDGTQKKFEDIYQEADYTKLGQYDNTISGDISGTDDYGTGTSDPCWNSGIDSMAWIACPAETNLKYFASGIAGYIDDWLEMDSTLYDNNSGAHTAWEYVRTIANTLMIIMLGVIIFSQLTGVGIDNYGIKKILPKFVVMAILINLSFFICQLAVDLSNIAGNGIQGLFYGVGNNIVDQISDESKHTDAVSTMQDFIGAIVPSIYAAAAAGSGIISIASIVTTGGGAMAVMLVILLLLTILISVLVFFVSIGARIVIVIMCMVLAPLAFACYILPNTKSIFKKWFDAFKIAILIYPICGAMIGISYIIKAIAVTTDMNLAFMVIAGIAPFLPFFMIPTLLRGAFNTLGVAGAALSSMGNTLKNNTRGTNDKASNAIRDSASYKAGVEDRRRKLNRWRANIDKDGNAKTTGRFGTMIRGGNKAMAAARMQVPIDENKKARETALMKDGNAFAAAMINQKKAAESDEVKDFMTLLNDQTQNGEQQDKLFELLEGQYAGSKAAQIAGARIAGRRKDTAVAYMERFEKNARNYSPDVAQAIAKEMTTGENSGMYRQSAPLRFGWASAMNKGEISNSASVDDWGNAVSEGSSVSNYEKTLNAFVTDSSSLSAMKGSELTQLAKLVNQEGGPISADTKAKLSAMATDAIENRDKHPIDYEKAKQIADISGKYTYNPKDGFSGAPSITNTTPAPAGNASGAAQPDTTYKISHGGAEFMDQINTQKSNNQGVPTIKTNFHGDGTMDG